MCSALFWPSIQAGSTCTCGVSNHTFTSPHVYAYMQSVELLPGVLLNAGTWLASTWTWLLFCTCGCLRGVVRLLHCKDVTGPLCQTAWSGTSNSSVRLEAWRNHWTAVWSWPQETTVQMNCACIHKVCMTMCRHVAGQEIDWSLTAAVYMASLPGLDKTSIYVSSLFPSYTLMLSLIVI